MPSTATNFKCPACIMRGHITPNILKPLGENATSRFARNVQICGDCGVHEAFNGFFWINNLHAAMAQVN